MSFKENQYQAWCEENDGNITPERILAIFEALGQKFGFQDDNVLNVYDLFMTQLDSRSSRMCGTSALQSLHIDYIGGLNANFKTWYMTTQYFFDQDTQAEWTKSNKKKKNKKNKIKITEKKGAMKSNDNVWLLKFCNCTEEDLVYQIALYLLIWGEANNIRFMPECICFIYQCALDYQGPVFEKGHFLDKIITPIYNFLRDQQYHLVIGSGGGNRGNGGAAGGGGGVWCRKEIDHSSTIGYDDVNQHFWSPQGLLKLKLYNTTRLYDTKKELRYSEIPNINWKKSLSKTYKERRTWIHVLTNFNRIWIVHVSVFWFFMSFNSPSLYTPNFTIDKAPFLHIRLAIVSAGGGIAALISLFAAISEYLFIKSKNWKRIIVCIALLVINALPIVYNLVFLKWDEYSHNGDVFAGVMFTISILTFAYLAVVPPGSFDSVFALSFPTLKLRSRLFSLFLWITVFAAKYSESYFFLILSLKDPIQILSTIKVSCNDKHFLCPLQPKITLLLFYLTDLILFFLDTYLWYVLCNCIFSVALSFSLGVSIFTPWRNIFARLPDRVLTKIYHGEPMNLVLVMAQIWNSIIISMFREHMLSVEQVGKLIYQKEYNSEAIKPPMFFVNEDDNTFKLHTFIKIDEEWERRITFFAQSLSSPLPEPFPVVAIPSFTVLVPHYSEKILISLKDLIKEQNYSKLSLLEYLKQLHAKEWESFVQDSKMVHKLDSLQDMGKFPETSELSETYEDLPYYCIGFKDSSMENILRTRIWAALRCQTLYRTVSGFMNYEAALKILYRSENVGFDIDSDLFIEEELQDFVDRKFHLLVAMQNFQNFTPEVAEDADALFRAYPKIHVATLEVENDTYYSTLLDVSHRDLNGEYIKKYRIKLSGNPILGDGKLDNQNNALIFYRGEYIQVIDANQDNYIEECLKVKSLLAEFEEMDIDISHMYPYIPCGNDGVVDGFEGTTNAFSVVVPTKNESTRIEKTQSAPAPAPAPAPTPAPTPPVAIVGAREFIFSQNVGILGDIAAGKEQTFGTLFARTMAEIGSKLHYGHPDFLNGIFMTTRGGISKAQKGLHLNEDIYAGITATCRGGRIKHCDYYQCGKGRDLGFQSIVNFTRKIGTGMGEQLLSREYFYLGSKLPIDRFLSFYYAHPGFHINNLSIMLSVKIFMLLIANLGALNYINIQYCEQITKSPTDNIECHDLASVLNWIDRFVLSVFVCFFISFLPLIIQELIEKGIIKAIYRTMLHIVSLSPFFEVFICQVYSKALRDNLVYGEAKYIATGRGFAISRVSFAQLYTRYANLSIYYGGEILLVVIFGMMSIKREAILWFVITIVSLCLAPFLFNPHQFNFIDFFVDYRDFIRWLSRGNSKTKRLSWINFTKTSRLRLTGEKYDGYNQGRTSTALNLLFGEVFAPSVALAFYLIPFLYLHADQSLVTLELANPLFKLAIVIIIPYLVNTAVLAMIWVMSLTIAPVIGICVQKTPAFFAAAAHFLSILFNILNIELLFFMENWSFVHLISGLLVIFQFHRVITSFILVIFVSRERLEDVTNNAWWSGKWYKSGLGFGVITQNARELIIKNLELNKFTFDFLLGHFLLFALFPILLVPYIDTLHTSMLFWLKPSRQLTRPILNRSQMRRRNWRVAKYFALFSIVLAICVSILVVPPIFRHQLSQLQKQLFGSIDI